MTDDIKIEDYMYLIKVCAVWWNRRTPSQVDITDLIAAGLSGLAQAWVKYDNSKEGNFAGYARCHIDNAIRDDLRKHNPMGWNIRNNKHNEALGWTTPLDNAELDLANRLAGNDASQLDELMERELRHARILSRERLLRNLPEEQLMIARLVLSGYSIMRIVEELLTTDHKVRAVREILKGFHRGYGEPNHR